MTKLYDVLFRRYPSDQQRDQQLHARLRSLQFLEPVHLEIPEDKVQCAVQIAHHAPSVLSLIIQSVAH